MPLFLQEVGDLIAELLDDTSLKALSLVSQQYRHTAQRVLFRKVELGAAFGDPSNALPPRLLRLLSIYAEDPNLPKYTRRILIRDYPGLSDVNGLLRTISSILDLICASGAPVQHFSFVIYSSGYGVWNNLEQKVKESLLRVFKIPTLRSLHAVGLTLPRNIFLAFSGLEDVAITWFRWSEPDASLLHPICTAPTPGPGYCEKHIHVLSPLSVQVPSRTFSDPEVEEAVGTIG